MRKISIDSLKELVKLLHGKRFSRKQYVEIDTDEMTDFVRFIPHGQVITFEMGEDHDEEAD